MFKWIKNLFNKKDEPLVLTNPIKYQDEVKVTERPVTPEPTKKKVTRKPVAKKEAVAKKTTAPKTEATPKKRGRPAKKSV